MSLLGELRKEAERTQAVETEVAQSRMEIATQGFLIVQSRFKIMLPYLRDLSESLNVMGNSNVRAFYLTGYGMIDDYRSEKHDVKTERITLNGTDFTKNILMRFVYRTDRVIAFEKHTHFHICAEKDNLQQANIRFTCNEFRGTGGMVERAEFKVTGEIPVHIKITADFEHAMIFLETKNVSGPGSVSRHVFDAGEINHELMDEFTRFLLGRTNDFLMKGRHQQALREKTKAVAQKMEVAYTQEKSEEKKGIWGAIGSMFGLKKSLPSSQP